MTSLGTRDRSHLGRRERSNARYVVPRQRPERPRGWLPSAFVTTRLVDARVDARTRPSPRNARRPCPASPLRASPRASRCASPCSWRSSPPTRSRVSFGSGARPRLPPSGTTRTTKATAWSRRAAAWRRDDDDGDCDDCGTWWRAKRWRDASWWSKWSKKTTARDDDSGWVPGARRRVAKCMLGNCGSQLKKCRKDTVCRAAVQCAVGASIAPRERERRPPFARAPTRQYSDARPPPRAPAPRKGCGLGADAESRGCAFQCALGNSNDARARHVRVRPRARLHRDARVSDDENSYETRTKPKGGKTPAIRTPTDERSGRNPPPRGEADTSRARTGVRRETVCVASCRRFRVARVFTPLDETASVASRLGREELPAPSPPTPAPRVPPARKS